MAPKEMAEEAVKAHAFGIGPKLHETPESGKNAQLGNHSSCCTIIKTDCCQITQAVGQRAVVFPPLHPLVDLTDKDPKPRVTPSSATARAQGRCAACAVKSKRLDAATIC